MEFHLNTEELEALTSSQKAVLALEVEKQLAEEAKKRQREAAKRTNAVRWRSDQIITSPNRRSDNTIASPTGIMVREASKIVGVNHAYITAAFLLNHGYEFRRMYDDRHGVRRNWPSQYPPTLESRRAWLELIALLKGMDEA